jgi:hypothetical protein
MVDRRKAPGPPRRAQRPATRWRKNPDNEAGWTVEFALDKPVPVTDAEIRVLETYLGRQLDALFGSSAQYKTIAPIPTKR